MYSLLIWQKKQHWDRADVLHIEESSAGYFEEFPSSEQYQIPKDSRIDYNSSYDPDQPQYFSYFFDEITQEFCCNACSFKSKYRQNTTRHLLTHSGDRPFKCKFCNYSCSQNSNLKIHLRTHTGERPFKCNLCCYSSAHVSTLRSHFRAHHRGQEEKERPNNQS